MLALRMERSEIVHEDFIEAVTVVAAKKKGSLDYFAQPNEWDHVIQCAFAASVDEQDCTA